MFSTVLGGEAREVALRKLKLTEAQLLDLNGYRELPTPRPPDRRLQGGPA